MKFRDVNCECCGSTVKIEDRKWSTTDWDPIICYRCYRDKCVSRDHGVR